MDIEKRQKIERRIVKCAVEGLLKAGYLISVYDGEYCPVRLSTNLDEILEGLFRVDEEFISVRSTDPTKHMRVEGVVCLIYGNDGWDVIADHSGNLESALSDATALSEQIEEEESIL